MNVGARSTTQDLNSQIIEDYFEIPMSVTALQDKYGRHESTINKMIAKYKCMYLAETGEERQRKGKPFDPRRTGDLKSISLRHFYAGLHVTRYLRDNDLTATSFGHLISRSANKVGHIMAGTYPLTLEEVDKIATVLGIDFNSLLSQP